MHCYETIKKNIMKYQLYTSASKKISSSLSEILETGLNFFFKSNSEIMKNKKNSMKYQLNMNASKNYRCHDLCETNLIFNGILILILQLFDLYGLYVLRYESLLSIFFLYTQQIE